MKKYFSLITAGSIILITLCCLYFFRSIPVVHIWNDYNVLYVDYSMEEDTVLKYLNDAGCKDVITLKNQRIPLQNQFAPVQLKSGSEGSLKFDYIKSRLGYFTDESKAYRLFYIPINYQRQTIKAVDAIVKNSGVSCGLDGKSQYPWFVPLISICVFIFLAFNVKYLRYFIIPGFFIVLLSFSSPFYPVACCICLLLLALYLTNPLWLRRNSVEAVFRNSYIDLLILVSFIILFSVSAKSTILCVLIFCSIASSIVLIHKAEDFINSRKCFSYSLILSARQIPVIQRKSSLFTLYMTVPVLIILSAFLISSRINPKSTINGISLPCPSMTEKADFESADSYSNQELYLPNMEEYFQWSWYTVTFPYKNLNARKNMRLAKEGDTVILKRYQQTSTGIQSYGTQIMEYNDDFKNNVLRNIDELGYPSIERLLSRQDFDMKVSYSFRGSSGIGSRFLLNLVLILVSLFIPLLMYGSFYLFFRGRINEEGK